MSPGRSGTKPGRTPTIRPDPESRLRAGVRLQWSLQASARRATPEGEWIGAEITLQTPLLAQYAVSHYLEQDRVLDADVVD